MNLNIVAVENTNEIPTTHDENYILLEAKTDADAVQELAKIVRYTWKQIGKVYRLGSTTYYAEVVG